MTTANKHKHLDYIQMAINRMASNLFLLKGWCVTLIAALSALSAKDADQSFAMIAYMSLLMFWTLDGYFLSQERRFRSLYESVRGRNETDIDFSMSTAPFQDEAGNGWMESMLSKTLVGFYFGLAVAILILQLLRK